MRVRFATARKNVKFRLALRKKTLMLLALDKLSEYLPDPLHIGQVRMKSYLTGRHYFPSPDCFKNK